MHVLGSIGHGFGHRRKTTTPKDLHIRKISFSGCSLSSGGSLSSSSSTSTARMPSSAPARTGSHGAGPLGLHPTFQPPPRLHERPLISPERKSPYAPQSIFYDDSTDDDEGFDEDDDEDDRQTMVDEEEYTLCRAQELHFSQPFSQPKEMVLSPPRRSSTDDDDSSRAGASDDRDYYLRQLAMRPSVPRSRWSDSTIQTLGCDDLPADEDTSDAEEDSGLEMPNFSRKRCTAPSRPPMRSLDSFDDLIKKGGWKRRGVVFDASEVRQHSAEF
ncbi:hypothetical protein E4U54_005283 [Claviceps lovelessii]|nr:hypothetical protein E4U54_005283 [Claviceps lovelessii]